MSAFASKFLHQKNFPTLNVSTKKLCVKLWYEKAARKMLVKLTPGMCGSSGRRKNKFRFKAGNVLMISFNLFLVF
jgi:hypothetical protein